MGAEDRWERIAQGLFWTGWLFVAFTVYGIYSGDDWRGVVMTIVPGALTFALWYAARARADALANGTSMPMAARVILATILVGGGVFVVNTVRHDAARDRAIAVENERHPGGVIELGDDVEQVTLENGEKVWLVRKHRPRE